MKKSKRNQVVGSRRRPDFAHLFRTKARDGAGWTSAYAETSTLVDSTNPVVSVVEISDSAPNVYASGNTVYYGLGAGSFEVTVDAQDPIPAGGTPSGLDRVVFPSTTGGGTTVQYDGQTDETVSHIYQLAGSGSYNDATITTRDRALRTGSASFNVIHDAADPEVSLSAVASGATINVSWSNTTDTGSGVAYYDVTVRIDGGDWTPWLAATTDTSTTYDGEPGHQYAFQVTAIDNVGNTASTEAEATARHITKYYHFGSQRVAMRGPDGAVTWLHGDHLGSTSLATNDGGGQVSRQLYYPFGESRWSSAALPTDFGYTGQREARGIGLYDYHARWYDGFVGRFISADSIVPEPGNPQDFSRYSYVRNNPLKHTDPSGHCIGPISAWVCIAVGSGLIGLGVDALVAKHVEHEDYSVERGVVAFGVNSVAGLVGAYVIPGSASLIGQGATKTATALGATEATATIVRTGATVAADAALAGGTNAALGTGQRLLNRITEGEHITGQDVADDLGQNWKRDMSFGVVSSLFGQALNGLISANTTDVSPDAAIGPPVIYNTRYNLASQTLTPRPMNYTRWTPYIRGGLQSLASALSDASFLDLGSMLIERLLGPQPLVSPLPNPQRTPVPY